MDDCLSNMKAQIHMCPKAQEYPGLPTNHQKPGDWHRHRPVIASALHFHRCRTSGCRGLLMPQCEGLGFSEFGTHRES